MARRFTVSGRVTVEDDASPAVERIQGRFGRFRRFLADRFVITLGDVTRAFQSLVNAIRQGSREIGQEVALANQLGSQSLDAFLAKLNEVAEGTVSTSDLIASSSRALLLGIPAEEIAQLLEIARASAVATGQSVQRAFDDIVTGIGRASPLILDNLGIVVNLTEAYASYADQIGKTAETLTQAEKSQALLNEVLQVGQERVQLLGDSTGGTLESVQQAEATFQNWIATLRRLALSVIPIVQSAYQEVIASTNDLIASTRRAAASIVEFLAGFGLASEALLAFADSQRQAAKENERLRNEAIKLRDELEESARSIFETAKGTAALAEEQREATVTLVGYREALEDTADVRERDITLTRIQTDAQRELQRSIVITAAAFDALAASQGRASAVEAALAGGGTIVNQTRIRLPGGGSRLIRPPGLNRGGGRF